jgi:hypothetical protein
MGADRIHIQRVAPQDLRDSKVRMRVLTTGDQVLYRVWRELIDYLWIKGGRLPSDARKLSHDIGVAPEEIARCLTILGPDDLGFLKVEGEWISNRRISRELAEERAFRDEQAARGARGARARWKLERGNESGEPKANGTDPMASAQRPHVPATKTDGLPPPYPSPGPTPEEEREAPSSPPASSNATDRDQSPDLEGTSGADEPGPAGTAGTERASGSAGTAGTGARKRTSADGARRGALADVWNRNRGELLACKGVHSGSTRAKLELARLVEEPDLEVWAEAVRRVARQRFCRGGGPRGWWFPFDKLLEPGVLLQIQEGYFDDRTPVAQASAPARQVLREIDPSIAWLVEIDRLERAGKTHPAGQDEHSRRLSLMARWRRGEDVSPEAEPVGALGAEAEAGATR